MDFSVKDFNVRLRTIRLREVIIAYAISTILSLYLLENVFFISNDQMPTIIFDLFMTSAAPGSMITHVRSYANDSSAKY